MMDVKELARFVQEYNHRLVWRYEYHSAVDALLALVEQLLQEAKGLVEEGSSLLWKALADRDAYQTKYVKAKAAAAAMREAGEKLVLDDWYCQQCPEEVKAWQAALDWRPTDGGG